MQAEPLRRRALHSPRIKMLWLLFAEAASSAGKCLEGAHAPFEVQRQLVRVETAEGVSTYGGSDSAVGVVHKAASLDEVWIERHEVLHLSGLRLRQPEPGGGRSQSQQE